MRKIDSEILKQRAYEIYVKRLTSTEGDDWNQALNEIDSERRGECASCHKKFKGLYEVSDKLSDKPTEKLTDGSMESMDALKMKVIYWQKNWKIPKSSWSICGFSRSAFRTGFYIPELNLMLDAGPQNFNKPDFILVTHTHVDHIANLPLTLIGDPGNTIQIYGPLKAEPYVVNYINAMFSVNAMGNIHAENSVFKYNGLTQNEMFDICANKSDMKIHVFKCDHAIPTISYGISEIKTKIKEEYSKLPGKEIATMRKEGVEITHLVAYKKLAYVCDTSIKVFDMNHTILEYPVVFIECTFIYDDELQNAIDTQHIHWSQLKPIVVANPDTIFMLFHFSQRYRDIEINEFFSKESQTVKNIFWW